MPRHPRVVVLLLLIAVAPAARAGVFDFLLPHHDFEVISNTEMTEAGRQRPAPTREKPEYYLAVSLGYRDLGGVMGGIKEPPKTEVYRAIGIALAKQGFLPANEHTPPPTLVLTFTWGTLNTEVDYGTNPDLPPRQRNRQQILKFIGGYSLGFSDSHFDPDTAPLFGLQLMNSDARDFYDLAADDFYVAAVAAYDLEALHNKQKKILWITRIGSPSLGFSLSDVMGKMVAIGGVNFGHETTRPVRIRATDKYSPSTSLGELKVIDYLKPAPPAADKDANKKP